MGVAPYGEPVYEKLIRDNLIDIKEDGRFVSIWNILTSSTTGQ